MEIKDYMEIIIRRKWAIILTTLFALIVVSIGVSIIPQTYTATARVRASSSQEGDVNSVFYNVDLSERLLATYAEIAKSSPVLDELSQYVSPLPDPDKRIEVDAIVQTEILNISVTDPDPALAQHAANKLAEILIAHTRDLYTNESFVTNLYIIDPAAIPENPSSMPPWQIIAIGLIVGLIGGAGLAFVFENASIMDPLPCCSARSK